MYMLTAVHDQFDAVADCNCSHVKWLQELVAEVTGSPLVATRAQQGAHVATEAIGGGMPHFEIN